MAKKRGIAVKVEPITGGIRIRLSAQERDAGTFTPNGSEKALKQLIRQTFRLLHRPFASHVDAVYIPLAQGGVWVILSPHKTTEASLVYEVPGEDALLDLAAQWRTLPAGDTPPLIRVYKGEDVYKAVVYPIEPLTRPQQTLWEEYAYLCGCGWGAAAHCAAHGRYIETDSLWQEALTERELHPPVPEDSKH